MASYTRQQLRGIFQRPFDRDAWYAIVRDIFRADRLRKQPELITGPDDPEEGYYMGMMETPDHYNIGIFYYKIKQGSVAHKKVGLRNLVKGFVNRNWGEFDAALVVFNDGSDWRLSFICDIKDVATAPKRFTFVFGEPDNFYRTAIDRFETLQKEEATFENIRKAFSVEALSDDFFDEYRELYADFVQFITGKRYVKEGGKWVERVIEEPDEQYDSTFESDDKLVRDYIKKMFGRIVFLYFLQRKGWLAGNRQYMHDLFYKSDKKDDFLDGVLEPLFFEILNTDKPYRTAAARALPGSEEIPYLNGGLFASDYIDDRDCVFPADYFKRLFDFLDSYNFTIDENDSDDAEIGIDPEMLGRIFENLLEDNKDKGAFYTPKEIVEYMCRESIITYLVNGLPHLGEDKIRGLVEKLDGENLTLEERKDIKDKLKAVKICDPAIGSGAFPMGLVNLLSKLYACLRLSTEAAAIKRHIMEQSIYGVDIEKGAVDIARLRFWLAMIVEEEKKDGEDPDPLPNLHFKIMQGNSLLESYGGIDLAQLLGNYTESGKQMSTDELYYAEIRRDIQSYLGNFYNEKDHSERKRLMATVKEKVLGPLCDLIPEDNLSGLDISANDKFFLWHTWFSDTFKNGGFDIVIGNPPYGAKLSASEKSILKTKYDSTKTIKGIQKGSTDTYTMFIELAYKLMKKGGVFAMIVPLSLTSSDSLSGIHRILFKNCDDIRISSYAVRPQPVFKNAVVNTSILLFTKTCMPSKSILATKMYRKGKDFNLQYLIDHLEYIDVKDFLMFGRIPKISLPVEASILRKLGDIKPLERLLKYDGKPIFYRSTGGRYFKVVTDYSTGSSKEKALYFDKTIASAIGCILSSSLSFWFYQIYSNNLDWKGSEISAFPIPDLSLNQIRVLENLYQEYQKDIEEKAKEKTSTGQSRYNVATFKEYKIGYSKPIIDRIDDFIGPIYGLTQSEIDFIKNYEIEFRLSDEE